MKVLLVYANTNKQLSPPPVAFAYIAPQLRKHGHEVKILDFMFSKNPKMELTCSIQQFDPDIVGFSIRNLDNEDMIHSKSPLSEVKEYVNIAKSMGVATLLGGTGFTIFPKELLEYTAADYGITGQGEKPFPLLLQALEKGESLQRVSGLVWREGDIIRENIPIINGYADETVKADWDCIDFSKYKKIPFPPKMSVVTKSGCPFRCSYCSVGTTMGSRFFARDTDAIVDEIKMLKKANGINSFFLLDGCFNSPMDWSKELLGKMISGNLGIEFVTTVNPVKGCFDDEYFKLFKKAGGIFIMTGFDSFSPKMLDSYGKPFTIDDIYDFCTLASKNRLKYGVELLIGGPGENMDTVKESIAFLPRIHYSLLTCRIGVRILPQTAIFVKAIEEGLIHSREELLFPKFYLSRELDVEWAKSYIEKSTRRYRYRNLKMLPLAFKNIAGRMR